MVQKDKTLDTPPLDVEPSPSPVSGEACVEAPGPVVESSIGVETTGHRKFISGVVEGNNNVCLYGRWITVHFKETVCRMYLNYYGYTYAFINITVLLWAPLDYGAEERAVQKVTHFGCKSFALLFDDIDHNMCPADKEVFSSFAHAQVSITNEIYQYLGEPETFIFCPTGPYKGRSTELIPRLKGVLTNPNCEFESNFVAIHTLATWYKSNMNGQPIMSPAMPPLLLDPLPLPMTKTSEEVEEVDVEKKDSDEEPMEMVVEKVDDTEAEADPDEKDVAPILAEDLKPMDTDKESLAESKSPEESIQEDSGSDIAPMQTDDQLKQDTYVPGPDEKPLFTPEPPTLEDLCLLAELFYLPYEHGPKATQMLKEFNWLRANSSVVSVNCKRKESEKVAEWQMRAEKFQDMCCSVIHMFTRLSNTANRTILFDLYPYIWDIKSIMAMAAVYKICKEMYCEGMEDEPFAEGEPDLIGDRLVGGLLTVSSDYGFVLEDDKGICGYALGTADVQPFIKTCKLSWIPFMQEKYHKPDCEKDLNEAEVGSQYICVGIMHGCFSCD
ncbi:hypothetical protein GOODEAATRI_004563 [Goodea atripinnis]|uniref:GH84 domain-containing protein n=1 Tax=Goodea atripinnis TaxID=208336 RepID=A0ABV0MR66_9TELE